MLSRHSSSSARGKGESRRSGGITEIVLAHQQSLAFVLPSLASLSQQHCDRWLTWLVPSALTKGVLQDYDFDFKRTRFIYSKGEGHAFWLLVQALAEGNSHTVVGAPGVLSEQQMQHLECAADQGDCSGLILRDRRASH